MSWLTHVETLELIQLWIQLIAVPIGVAVFVYAKVREIRDREASTFTTLAEKYEAYLQVCLQHPDLPVFDGSDRNSRELSEDQQVRLHIVFCLWTSMLEHAYLLYRETRSAVRQAQWAGWQEYLDHWLLNPHYARLWPSIRTQFDRQFVQYADGRLQVLRRRDASPDPRA